MLRNIVSVAAVAAYAEEMLLIGCDASGWVRSQV